MTYKYTSLTVESVKHWYWECDPAYSMYDIARVTGASVSEVQRFMAKYKIPTRNRSEANYNRFKCENKKVVFIKQRNTPEFKKRQSEISKSFWLDESIRKKMVNGLEKYYKSRLGVTQFQILFLLRKNGGMFLTGLLSIVKKGKTSLNGSLRTLYNRGLVSRQKRFNCNTRNLYTSQYYYSITDAGVHALIEKEKEPKFAPILNSLKVSTVKNILELSKNAISIYLGKIQNEILRLFQERNSLFLTDLKKLMSINKSLLDKSLKGLFTRGILSRKKEISPYYANQYKHFKYSLTELGKKIKVE